ncbi:ribonucleotide reductase [Mycena vitilis]|nr:ribonucleotide reductase [Mycena vitilis]
MATNSGHAHPETRRVIFILVQWIGDEVENSVTHGMPTTRIESIIVDVALKNVVTNPDYKWIASRVKVDNMHRATPPPFSQSLRSVVEGATGGGRVLTAEFTSAATKYSAELDSGIVHRRDYDLSYETLEELENRCLGKTTGGRTIERPQHVFMRMALALHLDDIDKVLATYDLLSCRQISLDTFMATYSGTMGTYSGTTDLARSSVVSTSVSDSGIETLYDTLTKCVFAARQGASIAISAQGISSIGRPDEDDPENENIGLWPFLKFVDGALTFTRRQSDTRTDIVNITIEPWHLETRSVIEFNTMHQHELADQKSITITMSIPDIFMARVDDGANWSLFCPKDVPELLSLEGRYFDEAYEKYEASSLARTTVVAKDLWHMMLRSLIVTGGPSLVFKDSVNGKSNLIDVSGSWVADMRTGTMDVLHNANDLHSQQHVSVNLPLFVTRNATFNMERLHQVTKEAVFIADKAIDASTTASSTTTDRNQGYRAVAVGQRGLAQAFLMMRYPYDSLEAAELSEQIAETMYHAALEASCELAQRFGQYERFKHSPLAQGILQYHFWDITPSAMYDWGALIKRIMHVGVRNAQLIAIGPRGSEDNVSGFAECTDPITSNVLDGPSVCPLLVQELTSIGMWNPHLCDEIINAKGSIQQVPGIPIDIKEVYKTAWEIDPKQVIKLARARAPFVCGSQSISLHLESANVDHLDELMMRAWSFGLKNGVHRLHSRPLELTGSASSLFDDADREMSYDDVILSSTSSS